MRTVDVALVNRSTVVPDAFAAALAAALTRQATEDFAPHWGVAATVTLAAPDAVPPESWVLTLLDEAPKGDGNLAEHDADAADRPQGRVYCKTTRGDGASISVSASHELLEMLVDPHANLAAVVRAGDGTTRVYALEVCDACEDDAYAYPAPDGILVSDFVLPAYFDPGTRAKKLDFRGFVTRPFQVLPGGYLAACVGRAWSQVTGGPGPHHAAHARYAGNRYHRRSGLRHDHGSLG